MSKALSATVSARAGRHDGEPSRRHEADDASQSTNHVPRLRKAHGLLGPAVALTLCAFVGGCSLLLDWNQDRDYDSGAGDVALNDSAPTDAGSDGDVATPGVLAVGAGTEHACALLGDRSVWCWGADSYGQIGDGKSAIAQTKPPTRIAADAGFVALSVGQYHTCAIDESNGVWCWGANASYQLGHDHDGGGVPDSPFCAGNTACNALPIRVSGLAAYQVVALSDTTCARSTVNGALCWGSNKVDLLGSSIDAGDAAAESMTSPIPIPISQLNGMVKLIGGANTPGVVMCAITTAKTVKCWGDNVRGQLGRAPSGPVATPVVVALPAIDFTSVSGGESSCVAGGGNVWCWGSNTCGELGTGTVDNAAHPVPVEVIDGSVAAVVANNSICAVSRAGMVWCWGEASTDIPGVLGSTPCINFGGSASTAVLSPTIVSGAIADPTAAVPLALSNVMAIVVNDAGAFAWGENNYQQLGRPQGQGDQADAGFRNPLPLPVQGL